MIVFAVLLIIVSFIIPDHSKQVKNDLDQLSIQLYQETYQIKKRLKVLEEELLLPNSNASDDHASSKKVNPIIVNQVRLLKQQGLTVEQIAKQSALTTDEVNKILKDEVSRFFTYSEILLKSLQTNEKFAFSNLMPFIFAMRSNALELVISHPKP